MSIKTLSTRLLNYVSNKTGGKYDEAEVISARLQYTSNNETAKALGIPRRTVDRIVSRVMDRAEDQGETAMVETPKILVYDIETAPILGYMWHFWKGGTSPNMMERSSYVMSWAAKWLHDKEVMADALCYDENYTPGDEDDTRMLLGIWELLDEADFVVAHNGDNFDAKVLNTAFLLAGLRPPTPYRSIDTLKIAKRKFRFGSNKLDHILKLLEGRGKHDAGGFETWRGCMDGDMEAWDRMVTYNKQDVLDLETIYMQLRAWDHQHPSVATTGRTAGRRACTVCGSENVVDTGRTVSTNASQFKLFQCDDCGHHMRARNSLIGKEHMHLLNAK